MPEEGHVGTAYLGADGSLEIDEDGTPTQEEQQARFWLVTAKTVVRADSRDNAIREATVRDGYSGFDGDGFDSAQDAVEITAGEMTLQAQHAGSEMDLLWRGRM